MDVMRLDSRGNAERNVEISSFRGHLVQETAAACFRDSDDARCSCVRFCGVLTFWIWTWRDPGVGRSAISGLCDRQGPRPCASNSTLPLACTYLCIPDSEESIGTLLFMNDQAGLWFSTRGSSIHIIAPLKSKGSVACIAQ